MTQIQQPHDLGHHQQLDKQAFQLIQKTFAKCRKGIVIRMRVRRDKSKRHLVIR